MAYVIPEGRPDRPQDYIDKVEREVNYWKEHGGGPLCMSCNIWVFGELRKTVYHFASSPRFLYDKPKRPTYPDEQEFLNGQVDLTSCLVCQKETDYFCGRCKIVRFCSRDCQPAGWTRHKGHCRQTKSVALIGALSENSMFLATPDECYAIAKSLGHSNLPASVQRKHYFAPAAKLGGVFVG